MSVNDGENLKAYYDDQVVKGETKMVVYLLAGCKVGTHTYLCSNH